MEKELLPVISELEKVTCSLICQDKYVDALQVIKELLRLYDGDKEITINSMNTICKDAVDDILDNAYYKPEYLNMARCRRKLKYDVIKEMCVSWNMSNSEYIDVINDIHRHIFDAISAYKKDTNTEVRYCIKCGRLLMPGSMAYSEGYDFDTCI